jgi:hypothetical protein
LYYKGKGYELLSCIFQTEDPNAEQCPFLIDEDNVMKIRKQRIIIANIWRNKSTRLADEMVELKLKMGFKTLLFTVPF